MTYAICFVSWLSSKTDTITRWTHQNTIQRPGRLDENHDNKPIQEEILLNINYYALRKEDSEIDKQDDIAMH